MPLHTLQEQVSPQHTALVVLDMQQGHWPPLPGPRGADEALPNILRLLEAARKASVAVIFVKNTHSLWTYPPSWQVKRGPAPESYVEGTPGHDLLPGLEPWPGDGILIKHSYSAFAHGPMNLMLRCRGIRTVILTGGSLLGAVETAAKDTCVRGYYVFVVQDCVHPQKGALAEVVLRYIGDKLGTIVNSVELIRLWQQRERDVTDQG